MMTFIRFMRFARMKMRSLAQRVHCNPCLSYYNPSCRLFTPEEFLAFEYLDDIWFQHYDGPANTFSAALGYPRNHDYSDGSAPWVERMAHRLRSNSSQKLYFSFGHDITILPVLTALGLFSESAFTPLRTDAVDWYRSFRGGNHVPFCANLVVEKLQCPEADYVRVLNNQVPRMIFPSCVDIVPLEGCGNGPSGIPDGLCELEAFLAQKNRKKAVESGVEWFEERCGLNDIRWQ